MCRTKSLIKLSGDWLTNRQSSLSAIGTARIESQERSWNLSQDNWKIFKNFASSCWRKIIENGFAKKVELVPSYNLQPRNALLFHRKIKVIKNLRWFQFQHGHCLIIATVIMLSLFRTWFEHSFSMEFFYFKMFNIASRFPGRLPRITIFIYTSPLYQIFLYTPKL